MATAAIDPAAALPGELFCHMLSFLRPQDLARAREVCPGWARLADGDPQCQKRIFRCKKYCPRWKPHPDDHDVFAGVVPHPIIDPPHSHDVVDYLYTTTSKMRGPGLGSAW